MATRAELDEKARELGLDPDEFGTKDEVAAAIEAASDGEPTASEPDLSKAPKGTILKTLLHDTVVLEPGEMVPPDLSDEAVETLRRQGYVS